MAQQALSAGSSVPRKRVIFGLLDADGWGWAGLKAFAWLLIHRFRLGWLEERVSATGLDDAIDERRSEAGVAAMGGMV